MKLLKKHSFQSCIKRGLISRGGVFDGGIATEIVTTTVYGYFRAPLPLVFIPTDTLDAGRVVAVSAYVHRVDLMADNAQVFRTIVASIAINMINFRARGHLNAAQRKDRVVHTQRSLSARHAAIEYLSYSIAVACTPAVCHEEGVQVRINKRHQPLRQGYFLIGRSLNESIYFAVLIAWVIIDRAPTSHPVVMQAAQALRVMLPVAPCNRTGREPGTIYFCHGGGTPYQCQSSSGVLMLIASARRALFTSTLILPFTTPLRWISCSSEVA